jgi:hypothetical protein
MILRQVGNRALMRFGAPVDGSPATLAIWFKKSELAPKIRRICSKKLSRKKQSYFDYAAAGCTWIMQRLGTQQMPELLSSGVVPVSLSL